MDNQTSSNTAGLAAQAPDPMPTPEVGQTFTLQFHPYDGVYQVHGDQYTGGGTYLEVEVKAVKTAKVVLE